MVYAKIYEDTVVNTLELRRSQAAEFPDCVEVGSLPVSIGDTYTDGKFYRNGKEVKTGMQKMNEQMKVISEAALIAAQEACVTTDASPKANVGLFIMGAEPWEPGKEYARFDMFSYNGSVGWVKQAHTAQETWPPFSVGSEALYGARPVPDEDGIYPYVYNMAVEVGMKVRDAGVVYECIQGTESLLYTPGQVPALFAAVD